MRITTLEQLYRASQDRRAVTLTGFGRPQPAAWVISMQARAVLWQMRRGMYLYKKAKK